MVLTTHKIQDCDTCLKTFENQMSFMVALYIKTASSMTEATGRITGYYLLLTNFLKQAQDHGPSDSPPMGHLLKTFLEHLIPGVIRF